LEYENIPADELPLLDEDGEPVLDENGKPVTKRLKPDNQQPQGAVIIMDFEGRLQGIAGGLREKTASRSFNRATDGTGRQTGSVMKPLGAYCLGIEYNFFTYSTAFFDGPVRMFRGSEWPVNYSRQYAEAEVTVAEGISQSLNTIAVQAMEKVGPEKTYEFLTDSLGITTLVEDDKSTGPLALGSMTWGVKPYEMAGAYQVFGNDGTYYEPHSYYRVEDARTGEPIFDKEMNIKKIQAITPQTATIMNRLLQTVMYGSSGTGRTAMSNIKNPKGLPYAGKSGTTSDNKDLWFIGMNPYYVCVVWEGYDDPTRMSGGSASYVQPMFGKVMGRISEDLPYKNFETYPGVETATYCKATGDLAGPGCAETATGYYKEGFLPPQCSLH